MSNDTASKARRKKASLARRRGQARRLAMQAIYQWQMTGDSIADIRQQFVETHLLHNEDSKADADYFAELVSGVAAQLSELDAQLERHTRRAVESVDPVERAILRIAAFELSQRHDVPYRVVLNEAINLAKTFCAANSHAFINGVLDKLAPETRALEMQAEKASRS